MKRSSYWIAGVAAAAALTMAPGAWAQAVCKPNLVDATRSVVRVLATNRAGQVIGWGTGWVIESKNADRADNAVIVTSYHVVAGASYVEVIKAGESRGVRVRMLTSQKETSLDHDLTFLEIEGFEAPALRINRTPPDLSDPVYAIGYTVASDDRTQGDLATTASAPSGAVSRLFKGPMFKGLSQTPVNQVEHNAPIEAGYSGGPLLDRCGSVIGVNVADGGHVPLPRGYSLSFSKGTSFALAANELVAEAIRHNVRYVTAAPPSVPVDDPNKEDPDPVERSWLDNTVDAIKSQPILLIGLILAALALVGAGVWLLRPTGPKSDEDDGGEAPPPLPPETVKPPLAQPTLVLTGRGPSGEALRFSFTVDQVAGGADIGSDRSKVKAAIDDRQDYAVSRVHARLDHDGQAFTIEDNKSSNGTKVGGVKLAAHKPHRLVDGDELELADVKLRVSIQS